MCTVNRVKVLSQFYEKQIHKTPGALIIEIPALFSKVHVGLRTVC